MEFHCPNCGAITPATGKFCKECAYDLRKPEETPTIDYSQPQSYTPKFLADKILTTRSSIEGERKLVTVFFADVVNYTSISEKLDPEEVHQIMDGCFKILMDKIHKYEGTINQFTGDGVMALFGAPVAHEDHAQRACHAALSIQEAIGEYGEKLRKDRGVEFKMRIGLNSGPVIVGSIGDDLRMDYTAVGDITNLAARMESMASPGAILLSGGTHRLVRDFFEFKSLGKIELKGKEEPQGAFELIKAGAVETRIEAAAARGLTRFVGRKNSMATLTEAYDKARSGSGQVLGMVGEAGVGKSRLLLEFRNRLPQGEFSYLEGRCLHYGGSMAYLLILDILRMYFDIKEGDQEFIIKKKIEDKIFELDEKLKSVLPSFQDLLSLKADDKAYIKLEPSQKRDRTFEALRDLLIRESQNKPLVLSVEDLHWIDRTSEQFLDYFIGWLANTPVLLILLYRPEYTHHWGSKSYYSQIGLTQLTTQGGAKLVQAILEGGEVVPELKELILSKAGGNPLFVEELTGNLLENGTIQRKNHQYVLARESSEIQVPETIQGIIAARIDRLEDNLKRTMQVASVIGRDFAFRILQTIIGMKEVLKSHLVNLQALEFIYEKRLFPELEYVFKHILTQEVAYNSLLQKRRKEIHGKIGKAIEEIYAERLEEFYEMLAYHFDHGEVWDKALVYLRQAGLKATVRSALQDARVWFEQALGVLEALPENPATLEQAFEIRLELLSVLSLVDELRWALERLREAETLAERLDDDRRRGRVCVLMTRMHLLLGELDEALMSGAQALAIARRLGDLELRILTTYVLGMTHYLRAEFEQAVELATDNLAALPADWVYKFFGTGTTASVSDRCLLVRSLAQLGRFAEAARYEAEAIRLAESTRHAYTVGLAYYSAGTLHLLKGDWAKARSLLEHGLAVFRAGNVAILLRVTVASSAWVLAQLGETSKALNRIREGEQLLERFAASGHVAYSAWVYHSLGRACLLLGRLDEARSLGDRAVESDPSYLLVLFLVVAGLYVSLLIYTLRSVLRQKRRMKTPAENGSHPFFHSMYLFDNGHNDRNR